MAKVKSKYVCQQCGYESAGYLGKCPECASWSSFVEEVTATNTLTKKNTLILDDNPPMKVNDIITNTETRFATAISEFDRVLGGGIVQGSVILLAGDPGIGKSTLLLQTSGTLTYAGKKVLYTSAEESLTQIKLRAERLKVTSDNLYIYSQTNLEAIKKQNTPTSKYHIYFNTNITDCQHSYDITQKATKTFFSDLYMFPFFCLTNQLQNVKIALVIIMKKFLSISVLILMVVCLFGCSNDKTQETLTTTDATTTQKAPEKYADSKFLGKWYNAYSKEDVADFVLKADGSAVYKGKTKGNWSENGEEIVIKMEIDGEAREMKGYFVIAGDGFVARANEQNQHFLDEGKGELQLEIMLTENTCIDCVKK